MNELRGVEAAPRFPAQGPEAERPVGELVKELAGEAKKLVRQEAALAKTELVGKAKLAAKDAALIAGGAALAYFAGHALLAMLVLALGMVMPLWTAALVVGLVFAATAAALVVVGVRKLKKIDPRPRETIRTLEENGLWLREQMSR